MASRENARPPALPGGFLSATKQLLGEEFEAFVEAYEEAPQHAIRYRNTAVPSFPCPKDQVPWEENAWYLQFGESPGAQVFHEAGAYYLQEPSAMVPARVLAPSQEDMVLDLCAAPGGKSTQLAQIMKGKGCLVCNEIVPARARILSRNIERMGITNAYVTNASPDYLANKWQHSFDKILVDAPCSGEGMFRKDPDTRLQWQEDSPQRCAVRQSAIMHSAATMLKPGGRMVYSTCTFNRTENEGVLEAFLAQHPDFSLVPFYIHGLPAAPQGMLRLWPHATRGEGHFVALLQKEGTLSAPSFAQKKQDALDAYLPYLNEMIVQPPQVISLFGEIAVSAPPCSLSFDGISLLRCGLHLGRLKGKHFMPDHALALAHTAWQQLPLQMEDALRFLHGEVLDVPGSLEGWVAPCLEAWQLGWGKAVQGQLKNHYPKGLRK